MDYIARIQEELNDFKEACAIGIDDSGLLIMNPYILDEIIDSRKSDPRLQYIPKDTLTTFAYVHGTNLLRPHVDILIPPDICIVVLSGHTHVFKW